MDRIALAESNRPRRRAGYIEAVTVAHFVVFVFRLDVMQLSISRMVEFHLENTIFPSSSQTNKNNINQYINLNRYHAYLVRNDIVTSAEHGIRVRPYHLPCHKNGSLAMRKLAR